MPPLGWRAILAATCGRRGTSDQPPARLLACHAARLQAIALGADLVIHSATKYLAGHNDVLAGAIAGALQLGHGKEGVQAAVAGCWWWRHGCCCGWDLAFSAPRPQAAASRRSMPARCFHPVQPVCASPLALLPCPPHYLQARLTWWPLCAPCTTCWAARSTPTPPTCCCAA